MRFLPHYIHKPAKVVFLLSLAAALCFVVFWPEPAKLEMKVPAIYVDEIFSGHSAWFTWTYDNVLDEIIVLVLLISGLAVMFSAEEPEDEFSVWYRIASYKWPLFFAYLIMILAVLTVFGVGFIWLLLLSFFIAFVLFVFGLKRLMHNMQKEQDDR